MSRPSGFVIWGWYERLRCRLGGGTKIIIFNFKKVKLKYYKIDFLPATTTTKAIDIFHKCRVRRYDFIPRSLGELKLQPCSIWLKFTFFSMFEQPVRATGAAWNWSSTDDFCISNDTKYIPDANECWGVRGHGGMSIGMGNWMRFAPVSVVSL